MACFHPLLAVPYPSSHAKYGQYRILGSATNRQLGDFDPSGIDIGTGEYLEPIRVACGKCVGCLLDRSREWATRITCECMDYPEDSNWFVTLTYADECSKDYDDKSNSLATRNADGALILDKRHPQLFFKSVRESYERKFGKRDYDVPTYFDVSRQKEVPIGLRYFMCGEYGDNTKRPHYHVCLMNTPLPDVYQFGKTERGMPLFRSPYLESMWGRGFVTIGRLTYRSAAYCARYTLKKANGLSKTAFEFMGLTPEYTQASIRPGIGYNYVMTQGEKVFSDNQIILPSVDGNKPNINPVPRYFDKKYSVIDPKAVALSKSKRAEVATLIQSIPPDTDLLEDDYLEVVERSVQEKIKILDRNFSNVY